VLHVYHWAVKAQECVKSKTVLRKHENKLPSFSSLILICNFDKQILTSLENSILNFIMRQEITNTLLLITAVLPITFFLFRD